MKRLRTAGVCTALLVTASLAGGAAVAQKAPVGDEDPEPAAAPAPAPAGDANKGTKPPAPAAGAALTPDRVGAAAADPAPGAAGATGTAGPVTPPAAPVTGISYTVKLHDLERRVYELKEQVFRSKSRLAIMKEQVLGGKAIGAARATLAHRNEMGATYKLIKLVYALDGAEIFAKQDDSGHLGDSQEFEIYNGSITPGKHTVSVHMVYQGHGFGVFSYLKGYKANVDKTCNFTADEGRQTQLKVVAFESGNPLTTDWDKRAATECRINVSTDKPGDAPAAPAAPAKK